MLLVDYYTIKILNISGMTKIYRHKRASDEEFFFEQKGNGKETA